MHFKNFVSPLFLSIIIYILHETVWPLKFRGYLFNLKLVYTYDRNFLIDIFYLILLNLIKENYSVLVKINIHIYIRILYYIYQQPHNYIYIYTLLIFLK